MGINSCCTKKGCVTIQNTPSIYLTFSGYNSGFHELDYIRPFLYSTANDSLIDSAKYSYPKTFTPFNNSNLLENISNTDVYEYFDYWNSLKEAYIVVKTPTSQDTISDFDFSINQEKIRCNPCEKKVDRFTIQNFSFYHQGTQYFDGDTVLIEK